MKCLPIGLIWIHSDLAGAVVYQPFCRRGIEEEDDNKKDRKVLSII